MRDLKPIIFAFLCHYHPCMNYHEYILPEPYARFIECVWIFDAHFASNTPKKQLWLPNGTFDLVFNIGSPYSRINVFDPQQYSLVKSSAIIGQMKESVKIELGENQKVVGIRFKAYGLYAWLGIPIKEITGQTVLLNDLIGKAAAEWEQKIFDAPTHEVIISAVKQLLQFHHCVDDSVVDAVRQILIFKGSLKIKNLLARYYISQKTIENRFSKTVGIMPKELSRIYRFNHFLVSAVENPQFSFTHQTYECDFFDQSHLIHDFKKITSQTPKQFFDEHSELVEINRLSMKRRFMGQY